MNIGTGKIVNQDEIQPQERHKYVEVKRDLSAKEAADKQIRFYSPCGCGSGKKFKFCCHKKS